MNLLVIDPSVSGISGDMLIAALVDLGASCKWLKLLSEEIPSGLAGVEEIHVRFKEVHRAGLRAKTMRVIVSERVGEREPQELYSAIEKLADKLSLSSYVIGSARDTLRLLEEAEARVHGGGKSHFHELGSADTLLDIVGAPLLIEELGLSKARIVALPPAVGSGAVGTSHGVVSAPAPATLEVLRIKGLPS